MGKFRELLDSSKKETIDENDTQSLDLITEGIKPEVKDFMKEFNKYISFLKEDIKDSDTNSNYIGRLESIVILISKFLKK